MTTRANGALLSLLIAAIVLQSEAAIARIEGKLNCQRSGYCLTENLALKGPIDNTTIEDLSRILDESRRSVDVKQQPELFFHAEIELDSPGGSVRAAMAVGRLLRQNRMTARVKHGAVCNSACVIIYAGAVNRFGHFKSGRIGIHQPYFEVPQQAIDAATIAASYASMLGEMRSYFREMNVSEQLADEMLKTPPASIRYLSPSEQDQFGLTIFDPVENEIASIEAAQKLGLSRSEYIRRQSISKKACPSDIRFFRCAEKILSAGEISAPDFSAFGAPLK